jgi:hypothetical protein
LTGITGTATDSSNVVLLTANLNVTKTAYAASAVVQADLDAPEGSSRSRSKHLDII